MAKENSQHSSPVILRAEKVTKVFPGTTALDHVDFNCYRGKVNVLIGENGAGKSTLMKIIAGVEQPTSGMLLLEEEPVRFSDPLDASQYGIGIIYQELDLFPNLSVVENIFMAREIKKGVVIDYAAQEKRTRELMARLEQPIEPRDMVGDLRLGQQQIVAIAKALVQNVRILIMDEPTSALSAAEVTLLFKIMRELINDGVSIIYISHKLEELMQIGDYITVLRDGKLQAEAEVKKVDVPWIIEKMVGRSQASFFKREDHAVKNPLLQVENMSLPRPGGGYYVDNVSLTLHEGEILGLYGLMGAGRTELFECLIGLHPESSGAISLKGQTINRSASIEERINRGLVLVPEDRQRVGIVQSLSVGNNMTLASLGKHVRAGVLSFKSELQAVGNIIKELSIKVSSPQQPVTALSGGNQQKVVVGKGLMTRPKVLLLDEPTRGIDVGAKSDMFEIMNNLAKQGYGVLFASSELKEVLAEADRIIVMSKGKITGEFDRSKATEEALVAASAIGHGPAQVGGNNG